VSAVAERRAPLPAGLSDPHRPIGSFILCPTGVGKTELARPASSSRRRAGDVRLDMSEYLREAQPSAASSGPARLCRLRRGGTPNGPEPCAAAPTRWSSSTEIEKAHQDVFNVLLQVLDDGRLTDGHGALST